jgi:hypothetical protein
MRVGTDRHGNGDLLGANRRLSLSLHQAKNTRGSVHHPKVKLYGLEVVRTRDVLRPRPKHGSGRRPTGAQDRH